MVIVAFEREMSSVSESISSYEFKVNNVKILGIKSSWFRPGSYSRFIPGIGSFIFNFVSTKHLNIRVYLTINNKQSK